MPFPGSSDYPVSVDTAYGSGSARVDNTHVVYDDDFNFPDIQIRQIQTYLGVSEQLIGQGVAGRGPGGLVSPLYDGGGVKGIVLALRRPFTVGDILSIGDDYDAVYTEKLRLGPSGILWTLGGGDFGSGEFLRIPHGNSLPVTFEEGRLFRKDDTDEVYHADGSAWNLVGGTGGFESDFIDSYKYTQAVLPIEETLGSAMVDGSRASSGATFWVMMDPTFASSGTVDVKLYDVGPKAGPAGAPVLICTLQASAGGLAYHEQALTAGGSPGANQIQNTERMYEATVIQNGSTGDNVFVGCGGIAVR